MEKEMRVSFKFYIITIYIAVGAFVAGNNHTSQYHYAEYIIIHQCCKTVSLGGILAKVS